MDHGLARTHRDSGRAPGLVQPSDRRAGSPPTAVREGRSLQSRLRSARPGPPLLRDREPHEPVVGHPRARAVCSSMPRRCSTTTPRSACRSSTPSPPTAARSRRRSSSIYIERAGGRYPRTLVVNHRDKILKALDQDPLPARGQAECRRLGGGHRPLRLARGSGGRPRGSRLRPGRNRARAGVPRIGRGGDRAGRGHGRPVPVRDPHRPRAAGRLQPVARQQSSARRPSPAHGHPARGLPGGHPGPASASLAQRARGGHGDRAPPHARRRHRHRRRGVPGAKRDG